LTRVFEIVNVHHHRQRDGVLRTLTDAHLVEVFAMPTGGRPSQWIKLAGNDVPTDQ